MQIQLTQTKSRPLFLSPSKITWTVVFLALFSPPLVPRTSIRIDSVGILVILLIIVCLMNGRLVYDQRHKNIIHAYTILAVCVSISIVAQLIIFGLSSFSSYVQNLYGFVRPLFYAILFTITIRTEKEAEHIAQLLLFGVIVHGILTIIEYLNITPISAWLNVIARGNIDADVGTRAVGAFGYVHGLGFFGTFFILYALYIIFEYPNNYLIRYLAYISVFFSIVNTGLSFSRAAWLATAVGVVSFLLPRWRSRRLNRLFPIVGVTVLSIIVALLSLNAETLGRFNSTVSSFIDGAKWVFGNQSIDESKIQFVTGRINHGWENAIAVWFENPLFGRLIIQGNIFVGDGGYTAMLAQQGLVGLVGFVGWCTLICRQLPPRSYCDIRQATVLTHMNRTFVVTILTASLATGAAFSERILELLPILLMTLQMLPVQQKA